MMIQVSSTRWIGSFHHNRLAGDEIAMRIFLQSYGGATGICTSSMIPQMM